MLQEALSVKEPLFWVDQTAISAMVLLGGITFMELVSVPGAILGI
jgi:hypothetical protein